jgi:small subunit ribosomal protein S18
MTNKRLDLPFEKISYQNPEVLSKFTTETGRILPRKVTGVSAKMHRAITREIKRARAVNLLP